MQLAEFQKKAINQLLNSFNDERKEVVLKSCTGSGKTIILTHFMDEYFKQNAMTCFVWLTPGRGNLEEQSKAKMDLYIPASSTKLLSDILTEGFAENDACFINWEKLTKKGNNALKEGERKNFIEHIEAAKDNGINFIVIIDESHYNNTIKANDIIRFFKPIKIIHSSATPRNYKNPVLIEVPESRVIAEGLIKETLIINQDIPNNISVANEVEFLIELALKKRNELLFEFKSIEVDVNPLVIIQIPDKSDALLYEIENYLEKQHITYENELLAVWLDKKKENCENIEKNSNPSIALIMKQAIAMGWDCPRAHILVKLRENMTEIFEIQTIGRIRRMPEAKHYGNDLLDNCYLFTLDNKFTEGVRQSLGKDALAAHKIFLKEQYRDFTLIKEQKKYENLVTDATQMLKLLIKFYSQQYKTDKNTTQNQKALKAEGYVFSDSVMKKISTGEVHTFTQSEFDKLEKQNLLEPLNTTKHGRDFHKRVHELGTILNIDYIRMSTIIRRLFDKKTKDKNKVLELETRNVYAFVLNNFERLKNDIRDARSNVSLQEDFKHSTTLEETFKVPLENLFTYDDTSKVQEEYIKNVYEGYLSSAAPRSTPERRFEEYCEKRSANIEWFYKNGDKGAEYFSIVYADNSGKQKSFYPDYIISANNKIWIIETKGGWDKYGASQDIDDYSPYKFEALERYIKKHNLNGGFVKIDGNSQRLFICTEKFNNDISSSSWTLLSDVF